MAIWGISTQSEYAANYYAIPKHLIDVDRNRTPHNCFADDRGWVYRHYGDKVYSGLSTSYYDEVLVNVTGLGTTRDPNGSRITGLGAATPVAVFFEDPNVASPISIGAGGTDRIVRAGGASTTGISTGFVHVVWNEPVFCSAGATVNIRATTGAGTSFVVGTAVSMTPNVQVPVYFGTRTAGSDTGFGYTMMRNFNGQIGNRIAFRFTTNLGIGTILNVHVAGNVVGTITDFQNSTAEKTFTSDMIRNVGGAGTFFGGGIAGVSTYPHAVRGVGIGTTTLTIK